MSKLEELPNFARMEWNIKILKIVVQFWIIGVSLLKKV